MSVKPNSKQIRTELLTVTPEMAEDILANRNPHNRPIRESTVLRYMRDMLANNWTLTGESIKFDVNGDLLDGQHRLTACAKSRAAFRTFAVYNVATSAQDVMDTGVGRTVGDQLKLAGHSYGNNLAATAKLLIIWENKWLKVNRRYWSTITHTEIIDYVRKHDDLEAILLEGLALRSRELGLRPGIRLASFYILAQIDHDSATEFFERLNDGADLGKGNPILTLRNALIRVKSEKKRLDDVAAFSMIFRAWNAWRDQREMRHMGFSFEVPKPI